MNVSLCACIGLLVLAALVTGCTNQPAQTPVSTTAVPTSFQTAAVPAAAEPSLTSTTWTLAWFDDTKGVWSKVADGSAVTATFSAGGKVTGSGGCNGYSADYQLGDATRIWFRRPEVPHTVTCQTPHGVMSQESAFFTDLEWAETYSITDGQLVIFDRTNKKILQFDPS
jgi:heat shock protein HslJ